MQITSHSWFQPLDFTDPRDGQVFVINHCYVTNGVLDAASKFFSQPSPLSHYSETVSREFSCSPISNKNFSYRVCSWNKERGFLEELPYEKHDEFWLGCAHELAGSEFLKAGAKTADKFQELVLTLNESMQFSYQGVEINRDTTRPSYVLELLTGDEALASPILLEKLLHAQYLDRWLSSLPSHRRVLNEIFKFFNEKHHQIAHKLQELPYFDVALEPKRSSSPRSVLFKMNNHRIEGFLVYKNEAYGLSNFSSYFLKRMRHPRTFDRLFTVINSKKALFEVFHPEFEFTREGELYRGFEKGQMTTFQALVESLAESHKSLPTSHLDKIILTYLSTINMLHAAGIELGYVDLDMLYINPSSSTFEKKLFVYKCSELAADSFKDTVALGMICYNLWVLYKMKGELTFYDISDAQDPVTIARVIAELDELSRLAGGTLIKERLAFIKMLLKGSVPVKEAYILYQVYYNEMYFNIPKTTTHKIFSPDFSSNTSKFELIESASAQGLQIAKGGAGSA